MTVNPCPYVRARGADVRFIIKEEFFFIFSYARTGVDSHHAN